MQKQIQNGTISRTLHVGCANISLFFFFSLTSGKSLDYFNTKFIFTTGHGNPSWSLQ
jgi:hypothetical protein